MRRLIRSIVRSPQGQTPPRPAPFGRSVFAYHEFSHPHEIMTALVEDLTPYGRVVLVEYRREDPSIPIKTLHTMTETQARKETQAVGLEGVETKDMLPRQHSTVFRKPPE